MEIQFEEALEILTRTPATLRALLAGLSVAWIGSNDDRDEWSPYAVLGHLIHGEQTDWLQRAEIILQHGTARPFEPLDRLAQFEKFAEQPLDELLDTFARLRHANLARLRAMQLTGAQGALQGMHPALGVVTLHQLLATWVVHDLNHIGQIAEAMAKRYTEAVGPWRGYLPILTR